MKKKLNHNSDTIDLETRNTFSSKQITTTVMKCMCRYNHYRVCYAMRNKDLIDKACPRCNKLETWEYVEKYDYTKTMRKEFATNKRSNILQGNI